MPFTDNQLRRIYERTDGRCHICGGGLCFTNYGIRDSRGAWEIEHSVPKANGGTNHGNNLFPAHISCNRSKGKCTTRTARAQHGRTCAPLSKAKQEEARFNNILRGGGIGAALGLFIPEIFVPAILICSLIGYFVDPEGK